MYKPLCLVTAPVATRSGYGAHSRDIVRSLIELDKFDIKIFNVRWGNTPMNALSAGDPNDDPIIERLLKNPQLDRQPDIHIHITVPNEFQNVGKYNIGITAGLECNIVPKEWIDGCNRMDLIVTPSKFASEGFINTMYNAQQNNQITGQIKVNKPIEEIFEGSDTDIYRTTKEFTPLLASEMDKVKESWNYLFVGHWLQGDLGKDRKDTGMLVKTFLETLKNKPNSPGLIMKTSGATYSIIDRNSILKKIEEIKKTVEAETLPNIYLFHGDFHDKEMNELYNHPKVKAMVSYTHGEGFGRPLLEFSMTKKPIIVSGYSGHVDFLDKNNSILLPGTLTACPKSAFPDGMRVEGQSWYVVDYNVASRAFLEMKKNYRKYVVGAKKLAQVNRSRFSLKAMTRRIDNVLERYLPEFTPAPQQVQLKLPKLKKTSSEPQKLKLPKLKKV